MYCVVARRGLYRITVIEDFLQLLLGDLPEGGHTGGALHGHLPALVIQDTQVDKLTLLRLLLLLLLVWILLSDGNDAEDQLDVVGLDSPRLLFYLGVSLSYRTES